MEIDHGAAAAFSGETQRFVNWFQALPGATFHEDIAIQDLRGRNAGRGIIAKADIEAETVLFTIPRNAIICAETSALRDRIPALFDLDEDDAGHSDSEDGEASPSPHGQDSWTLLILVMLYEYQRNDSPWQPYLDVLPSAFDTPMFWSPAELSELQASALVARIGKSEADQMIRSKILSVIRAHEDVFFPAGSAKLEDDQLLELAHRMGSTIMAYAFDLDKDDDHDEADEEEGWVEDSEGRTMLGMVPMADMLNADAEFNAHINHGDDALTATALRTIRAGEEILNYYGPLPNGELLRRYGYVTPSHSRYDVVELPWELVETALGERLGSHALYSEWQKVKQLARSDEGFEESFVLERSSEDPDSAGQLGTDATFDSLPDELGDQFKTFLKTAKNVANIESAAEALSDREVRKHLYLQTLLDALQARERQYPTSLEDDERLVESAVLTRRQKMAVCVRKGEKQLLREAQLWITREMSELQSKSSADMAPGDEVPAAKRRRI